MGADNAGAPSMVEKQRFLKKIEEWRALGFETDDLEELLENDFDAFLRRRHQILKDQLPDERPSATEPVEEPAPMDTEHEPEFESIQDEPVEELEGSPGEDLLLVGEPLAPEPEPDEEPAEEGLIVVGKPRSAPTSKVHRTRREKPEKETTTKEPTETGPGDVEEEEEEELDEEEEDFEEEEAKPTRPPPRAEKPPGTIGGRVAGAIVIIILILAIYYFAIVNPIIDLNGGGGGNGGGDGEVVAVFDISAADGYFHGSIITFDAFSSEGEITNFRWTLDDDFRITEGTRDSERFSGYFVTRENIVKKESVTLKVSNDNNENTLTKEISLKPRTFKITEERLGDNGKYQVTGSLNIYNPNGIYVIEEEKYNLKIERVDIDFQSSDQPMTMDLEATGNEEDGFRQTHSVYKRTINQYLGLSGSVRVVPEASDGGLPPLPIDVEVTGTMDSTDESYTDFHTYNTIYGSAWNNLDITIPPISNPINGQQIYPETDITREDTIESYPDIRKNPMNFRLADLKDNELEIGDGDAIEVGGVIYHWDAEFVEYFYDSPVIIVNMSINDKTMERFNLLDFYSEFWIAENVSQPVKTHLYSVHLQDGTTSVLNYVSEMTEFNPGIQSIASQDCTEPTGDRHFLDRWPGMTYVPSNNWTFLPPTGKSTRDNDTSFDAFPIEDAIALAKNYPPFIDYNASHPDAYIINGYCTATGEWGFSPGTLIWNLTLGNNIDKKALNIVIAEDGSVKSENITIDQPPNSTSDFEPLLTFAGSEDILNDFSDKAFYDIIFNSGSIDFDQVQYGVQTNLLYPNVDITSISFIERSKYSYLITYDSQDGEQYNSINVALDAETGQLLYYWDYTYSGFQLF